MFVLQLNLMSQRQKKEVHSLETSKELVERELQRNGYKFITSTDKTLHDKVKKRHSRALDLLVNSKSMYILFGNLSSGKLDKIICFTCMVQFHRGGKS